MYLKDWTKTSGYLGITMVLAATLFAGCASKDVRVAGMPGEQYLVGGGLNIGWKAPEAGTIYLIEKKTRKLVETRSVQEGEVYTFTVDSIVRAQELGDILGVNFARAELLLYFEPAGVGLSEQARLIK